MTGFGKNEVGSRRFISSTTEDYVTTFIDMWFAKRMNGGRERTERRGIPICPVETEFLHNF
jgi:hypothetical protein